jgi:hypothetical protein
MIDDTEESPETIFAAPPRLEQEMVKGEDFPFHWLPETTRLYVMAASDSVGCDPAMVGVPLLSVLAAAIGNSRVLRVKADWLAPPVVWTCVIAPSGDKKSPGLKHALRFINGHDRTSYRLYRDQADNYDKDVLTYERDLAAWKKNPQTPDPPPKPTAPVYKRIAVDDITREALVDRFAENPRGLLLSADELAGAFARMDAYRNGKGGDAAMYLSMHDAGTITVDRKTNSRPVRIERAALCVTGGTQPRVFRRLMGGEHTDNGMLGRILLAMPPSRPLQVDTRRIPDAVTEAMQRLFDRLLELKPASVGMDGTWTPAEVGITPAALAMFDAYAVENDARRRGFDPESPYHSALSKLEAVAARLALVIHMVRWAGGESVYPDDIDADSMSAGIHTARWFRNETVRVYTQFAKQEAIERNPNDIKARVDAMLNAAGGKIALPDFYRRMHMKKENAVALLNHLYGIGTADGEAEWETELTRNGRTLTRLTLKEPPFIPKGDGDE